MGSSTGSCQPSYTRCTFMNEHNLITREIGIDAAHRIPDHQSKCRNLHGHRYRIEATCSGPLAKAGDQAGMVLDFSFLKQEMLEAIDTCCDHGLMIWVDDPLLSEFLPLDYMDDRAKRTRLAQTLADEGQASLQGRFGKLVVLPVVPTAENLARHWYERLAGRVHERSFGRARLHRMEVWETPNCRASYQPA